MNTTNAPESTPPAIPTVLRVSSGHKRNGKVARLPKAIRDKINQWLDDGRTYPQIIKDLGDDAKDLKPSHFSEWRKGGYEDHLRHQEWRDQLRILREYGSDMSELTDGPKFQETLIQIALTEIFRVLQERELKPDSLNYIRLFNALARLNREALSLRKYNDLLAKEEVQLKQLDPKRKLTDNEHRAIADIIDQVMEMPRPRPLDSDYNLNRNPASLVPAESSSLSASGGEVANSRTKKQKTKAKNPSASALPSRPCQAETPQPPRMVSLSASGGEDQPALRSAFDEGGGEVASKPTRRKSSAIKNRKSKIENCLDCGSPLPPVPPEARRRPDDHCPSCGMRLPDIGLCDKPGFDKCLNCEATQPHLLPNGERPRPHCHKCGERLHNPEPPHS